MEVQEAIFKIGKDKRYNIARFWGERAVLFGSPSGVQQSLCLRVNGFAIAQ